MSDHERPILHAPYAIPTIPAYGPDDQVRFRLILSDHGWCVGILWTACEFLGLPGRAGVSGSAWTQGMSRLKDYLSECSNDQVDGAAAFDASVADSRGTSFTQEFGGDGRQLEAARQWVLGYSDDTSWARGMRLPSRTQSWDEPLATELVMTLGLPGSRPPGLMARGAVTLLREAIVWLVVPDDLAMPDALSLDVTPNLVRVFDEYGDAVLADASLRRAFSISNPSRQLREWRDVEGREVEAGELHAYFNDEEESVGLFLHNPQGIFVRGERRWYRLPPKSPLAEGWSVVEVETDMIHVWDEYESADRLDEVDMRLARTLAGEQATEKSVSHGRQQPLFNFPIPRDIAGDLDLSQPELIARGPFVVELPGMRALGCDLRREGDNVTWSEGWRRHVIDETCSSFISEDSGPIEVGDPYMYGLHYPIRALALDDASWALPVHATVPRSVDEFRQSALRHLEGLDSPARVVDVVMPNDGSWLVIDTYTGHTFGEEAVMVPEPPGELFDLLQGNASKEERTQYAVEHGRRLLMPGSTCGTPVNELEEWDEPPWLIDSVSGDCSWECWHLVVVLRPEESEVQALYSNENYARGHAIQHGLVPVAPFGLHDG